MVKKDFIELADLNSRDSSEEARAQTSQANKLNTSDIEDYKLNKTSSPLLRLQQFKQIT